MSVLSDMAGFFGVGVVAGACLTIIAFNFSSTLRSIDKIKDPTGRAIVGVLFAIFLLSLMLTVVYTFTREPVEPPATGSQGVERGLYKERRFGPWGPK